MLVVQGHAVNMLAIIRMQLLKLDLNCQYCKGWRDGSVNKEPAMQV